IRVKITQKPLTPGVYTLNYKITSADKTKQALGVARFRVSDQPTLKNFTISPAEFYAGNKNAKLRIETSLKDGTNLENVTLTFKRKNDDQDSIGTDVGVSPITIGNLRIGSGGVLNIEKLPLSTLEGNSGYIVTATVKGKDGQVNGISTNIKVNPKAELEVTN